MVRGAGRFALAGGAAVFAGALVTSIGATPVKPPTRTVNGAVEALAMDGPLVADGADTHRLTCLRTLVWDVRQTRDRIVSGKGTCRAGRPPFGSGFAAVAIAGSQVAWVTDEQGLDEEYETLWTTSRGGERKLTQTAHFEGAGGRPAGTRLLRLKGEGDLMVCEVLEDGPAAADSLQRVTSRGLAPLVPAGASITDFDVEGGRVALLRGGAVEIRSASGALMRSIPEPKAFAVALAGDRLVAATEKSIAVYDPATGDRVSMWPLAHPPYAVDAAEGVAAYAAEYTDSSGFHNVIDAIDLATGKERLLLTGDWIGVKFALTPDGLAYAFQRPTNLVYRLGFLPFVGVKAALG